MSIKHRPAPTRTREKLLQQGAQSLSLEELWMCILGMGRPGMKLEVLARRVARLTRATLGDQRANAQLTDLGGATQARILAVFALFARWQERQAFAIRSPQDVLLFCQDLRQARQEKVLALYCGTDGRVLHQEVVAVGSMNSAAIEPRDLFQPIRWLPVASLILCHNHPSGNLDPSAADLLFTKRVQAASELLGIELSDHLIITKVGYTSFREQGWLTAEGAGDQKEQVPGLGSPRPVEYSFPLG